jgi:hypothetical protein
MAKLKYVGKPIGSDFALAATLGMSTVALHDFVKFVSSKYSEFDILKKNGKLRPIASPNHDLKIVQKRINRFIFGNVEYPEYLFGGIPGQDYVKNANFHAGAKALITLDVRNFYPSISSKLVENVFLHFCKFPPGVAKILTELTTLNGVVPQGACTSSHIANLVLHDVEARIVSDFRDKQFTYSRLIDDISISAKRVLPKDTVTAIVGKVASALNTKGFKIRQSKTHVSSVSNPEKLMEITGLWLNRGKPRAKPQDREEIRCEMFRCLSKFDVSRTARQYHEDHDSVSGRVAKLTYLEHAEAARYRKLLRQTLPHYGEVDIKRIQAQVSTIQKSLKKDRGNLSYLEKYHKLEHELNIVSRTDPRLAQVLKTKMRNCFPITTRERLLYGIDV